MLRTYDSYHEGDIRHYGTHKAQQAMDNLLYAWAESTLSLDRDSVGKTFAMRVAAHACASTQVDPQADWKRSANGKESRGVVPDKPDHLYETINGIVYKMHLGQALLYAALCMHYGAYYCAEHIGLAPHQKADIMGITEDAYRKRVSRVRKYFVDNWPKDKLFAPVKNIY